MMGKHMFYCLVCCVFVALQRAMTIDAGTTVATTNTSANDGNLTETGKHTTTPIVTTITTTRGPEVSTLGTGDNSQDHLEELEDALNEKQHEKYMIYRSEASNNRTLHITTEDFEKKYEVTLCVQSSGDNKVKFQIIGLMYSNDGPSDKITIALGGKLLGTAKTDEVFSGGQEWNVFKDTGPIGEAVTLDNGNYTLSMTVKTDQWGAEFDTMMLRVHNQDPGANIACRSEFV